jgi:all-trans-retinol 13,14-reductase
MNIEREWDIICIGAGITSLAFAAQMTDRHPGTRILIVDKHSIPGGYATWFKRPKQGARFDCSLHKLSGMGAGGNLKRIFQSTGLDAMVELVYPSHYFRQWFPDYVIPLAGDAAALKTQLMQKYPADATGIETFFTDVETHGRTGYHQYQIMSGDFAPDFTQMRYAHRNLKTIKVSQKFAELFQSDDLRELLSAPGVYVGMFPEQMSYLYYLHVIYATLNAGNAYVVGSGQHLSNCLTAIIKAGGGEVMLSNPARRVLVDASSAVVGVETRQGTFYAPEVYINASPRYAMSELFPGVAGLDGVKGKLKTLRSGSSLTTLYLLTDVPPAELGLDVVENMLAGRGHDPALQLRSRAADEPGVMEEAYWLGGPMEVTNYHALDPAGGYTVVANVLDVIGHWPDRRSKEYKEKKGRAATALLQRLYTAFPALAGRIRFTELSTPQTYMRFTNNTDGSGFGALVGTDTTSFTFHYDFPVRGVGFLSSWVAGPGYEAAFGYAELRAKQWTAIPAEGAWRRVA